MRSVGPDTFCKIGPDLLCIATFCVILQVYFGNLLQNWFGINASKNEWYYIGKIDRNIGLFYLYLKSIKLMI